MNERPTSARKRRLTPTHLLLGLFLLGLAIGLAGGLLGRSGDDPHPIVDWLFIATLPIVLWVTLIWWRRLDEAAREAHKWAWYWGATAGILVVIPLLFLPEDLGVVALGRRLGFVEPSDLVSFGMFAVLILQVLGYGIAWAAWWLKRR